MFTRGNWPKFNISAIASNGTHIAPTRRSVMARLNNRMFERLCTDTSLFFKIIIIKVLKRTVKGDAADMTTAFPKRVM